MRNLIRSELLQRLRWLPLQAIILQFLKRSMTSLKICFKKWIYFPHHNPPGQTKFMCLRWLMIIHHLSLFQALSIEVLANCTNLPHMHKPIYYISSVNNILHIYVLWSFKLGHVFSNRLSQISLLHISLLFENKAIVKFTILLDKRNFHLHIYI